MQITQPITCRITLRRTTAAAILYGIISPKTGRKLEVMPQFLAELPRVKGRIVQAISRGMTASFTLAELRQFADAARRQAEPRPLRYWGRPRRKSRRPAVKTAAPLKAAAMLLPAPVIELKPINPLASLSVIEAKIATARVSHAIVEENRREAAIARAAAAKQTTPVMKPAVVAASLSLIAAMNAAPQSPFGPTPIRQAVKMTPEESAAWWSNYWSERRAREAAERLMLANKIAANFDMSRRLSFRAARFS
jgi:hypothetical protein